MNKSKNMQKKFDGHMFRKINVIFDKLIRSTRNFGVERFFLNSDLNLGTVILYNQVKL